MARMFAAFRIWDLIAAVACTGLFATALIGGMGIKSLVFFGAGVWWFLFSRYWAKQARAARRHRELREKRLERERQGLAPPRG
jgi:hypothetical protein